MHREKLIPGKGRLGSAWPYTVLASREGSWQDVKGYGSSLLTVLRPHPFFASTWPLPGDGVSGYHQHPGHPLWEVCQDSQGRWAGAAQAQHVDTCSTGLGRGSLGREESFLGWAAGPPLSRGRSGAVPGFAGAPCGAICPGVSRPAPALNHPRLSGRGHWRPSPPRLLYLSLLNAPGQIGGRDWWSRSP